MAERAITPEQYEASMRRHGTAEWTSEDNRVTEAYRRENGIGEFAPQPEPGDPIPRPGEGMFFQPAKSGDTPGGLVPGEADAPQPIETEGGESPSPDGTDSSTSFSSSETTSPTGEVPRPKRARATGSR